MKVHRTTRESSAERAERPMAPIRAPRGLSVERQLESSGAEAELFVCRDATGASIVLKVYRSGIGINAKVMEARSGLGHRHITRLIDHGEQEGRIWETSELFEGGDLRRWIEATVTLEEAVSIVEQLAQGLRCLHGEDIEHRDLKPENVLVRTRKPVDVAISDFGISSVVSETKHLTRAAHSIAYAPPEAIAGQDEVVVERTKWDAWSLGMMIIEMVTRRHPFADLHLAGVAHRLATAQVDELAEGIEDPAWRRLARGLTRRNPAQRWGPQEVLAWVENPNDPGLMVVEEERERGGLGFAGALYHHPGDLGQAMRRNERAAREYVRRRGGVLVDWLADTLGESERAEKVCRAMAFRAEQWPEESIRKAMRRICEVLDPEGPLWLYGITVEAATIRSQAKRGGGRRGGPPVACACEQTRDGCRSGQEGRGGSQTHLRAMEGGGPGRWRRSTNGSTRQRGQRTAGRGRAGPWSARCGGSADANDACLRCAKQREAKAQGNRSRNW